MFQLKYNGGFLDLAKDQSLEFERENPLFILDDFYKEYSSPITIKYTENNVALLGAIFFDNFTHQRLLLDAEIWDTGTFSSNVTMVIDKADPNRRSAGKGDVNGYLLAGISRFFFKIKFRYLNTLQLGGQRNFNFTTDNPTDGSDGYFQHFYNTANNTFDYMIAPVRNDIFNGSTENSSGWMNDWLWQELSNTPTVPTTDKTNPQYYSENEYKYAVVFPRLKYVLTQLFEENGYSLDTSELDGTNWEDIFLLSLYPIFFYNSLYRTVYDSSTGTGVLTQPFAKSITIDLSNCISPEITCATFILQICKKYGWTIIETKVDSFKIIALKNVKSFNKLDITPYLDDNTYPDFSLGERIQAFTNTFPSSEEFATGETPTITNGMYFETPVENVADLPDLTAVNQFNLSIYDNSLVYVYNENKFYNIALQKSTVTVWNNTRAWVPYVDNVYNLQPPNNTESIDTTVTTLPVYWTQYRTNYTTNVLYYGYFPVCQQSRYQNWGIRTMLFVGMVTESYIETASGPLTTSIAAGSSAYTSVITPGTFQYPLLSCCRNNGVTDILPWSNTYTHPNPADGNDYGIVAYWFQPWLDAIGLTNVYEQNIYLPKHILKLLTYDTILMIKNIPYLIQTYTEPIPYKGFILAKLIRVIMDKTDATVSLSSNIYVKLYWENLENADDYTQPFPYDQPGSLISDEIILPIPYLYKATNLQKGNLIVKAYSDPLERNLIPELNLDLLLRLYLTDPNGNLLSIDQLNDFSPAESIPLKAGNFHTKIYLEDGTANIPLSTLINDTNLVPFTWQTFPFYEFYNVWMPAAEAGDTLNPLGPDPVLDPAPYTFAVPKSIPPSVDGTYVKQGTLNVAGQWGIVPVTVDFHYIQKQPYQQDFIQHVDLRNSPNYIIIP